jgi:hypothetical protein
VTLPPGNSRGPERDRDPDDDAEGDQQNHVKLLALLHGVDSLLPFSIRLTDPIKAGPHVPKVGSCAQRFVDGAELSSHYS